MQAILDAIALENNFRFHSYSRLSGGDINQVFLLKSQQNYVVKINSADHLPKMFSAEAKGLEYLRRTNSFRIPQVINTGKIGNRAYLLLEAIKEGKPIADFSIQFAKQLVKLHKNTQDFFGLDHNNYIGSLPQTNAHFNTAAAFYLDQRLLPQLQVAEEKGFYFKNLESSLVNLSQEIPNEASALIHGDLWSGNFLVDDKGEAVLIDPAVSYASREMDLAMMSLFGGFSAEIIPHYHSFFPLEDGWKNRMDIWQLYYLLVHLNLFGNHYFPSVSSILEKYA